MFVSCNVPTFHAVLRDFIYKFSDTTWDFTVNYDVSISMLLSSYCILLVYTDMDWNEVKLSEDDVQVGL